MNELPATLDETYERTLREIQETKWESARRLLSCVTVASRPLRVEELAEILAFDFKSGAIPKFHKDWRLKNQVEAVLSACSTLLSVVNAEMRVVQFSHFTVKEFLTSHRFAEKHDNTSRRYHISMSLANAFVAQACLGVLLHLDEDITRRGLTQFPLAEYAAQHWLEHARFEGASQHVVEEMKQLFDQTKPHFTTGSGYMTQQCPTGSDANYPKSHLHPVVPPYIMRLFAVYMTLRRSWLLSTHRV